MSHPRPFELRDIGKLHKYRSRGLFLNSVPTLTWGASLVPLGASTSALSLATGVFTSVLEEPDHEPIIGQVTHTLGNPVAHFTFLAPDEAIESPTLMPLVEHLVKQVGARGAQTLVAEVEEDSQTFEALHRAGFSIYSRQRIWKVGQGKAVPRRSKKRWREMDAIDEFNIRKLYNQLVPTMVQQVEPVLWSQLMGWVLYEDGELAAYADMRQGPAGVWVQPFVHPEASAVRTRLGQLLRLLRPRPRHPVYICVRSYASQLAIPLAELGGVEGPEQAVMVRRLTAGVKKFSTGSLPELQGMIERRTTTSSSTSKSTSNQIDY